MEYLKKLLFIGFLLFILYHSWPFLLNGLDNTKLNGAMESIQSTIDQVKEDPEVSKAINAMAIEMNRLVRKLDGSLEELPQSESNLENLKQAEKPELEAPATHVFSIYNIELGDSKKAVEEKLGTAKRSTTNEYGVEWYTYHEDYRQFIMVAYDQKNTVSGLYTNQDLISSINGLQRGSSKESVLDLLGEPLDQIQKGLTFYQFQEEQDHDLFLINDSYITIFYDKHENNTVTSIQIIGKDLEQSKPDLYPEVTQELIEGFEYQLFDLTNATRVNHDLPTLTWDDHVRETARKHSKDMADHNYFNHTNLEGESPFDRMLADDIRFSVAGENLAYGQLNSIYAHEGLMNSIGHRENILKPDYQSLGVGVAFNSDSHPYFTENFFTD